MMLTESVLVGSMIDRKIKKALKRDYSRGTEPFRDELLGRCVDEIERVANPRLDNRYTETNSSSYPEFKISSGGIR